MKVALVIFQEVPEGISPFLLLLCGRPHQTPNKDSSFNTDILTALSNHCKGSKKEVFLLEANDGVLQFFVSYRQRLHSQQ